MISRTHRFHGRGTLQRHYNHSKSVRLNGIALRYARNDRRSDYRAAVVVSRKVSKSAVVRNRIRRRVYEDVRNLYASAHTPYDLVFIVYDEKLATMVAGDLAQEIVKLCQKARLNVAQRGSRAIVEPKE